MAFRLNQIWKTNFQQNKISSYQNNLRLLKTWLQNLQNKIKMKYKSQQVAYWFFALSVVLLVLQITYGFVMAFAHLGFDGLHDIIPFNAATATHKNLLVVWITLTTLPAVWESSESVTF